ncbi:MAG: AmmeMemoRadiSam system protein A [Candidatus Margulisbacteria bacterium]|nr:AmmeMemoRadiSam system protein A [Candidatus Margulisiibacteriota bacterium]MBU1022428.1 AmmeMemoRadiSam system protein A [Candidatus Margulisiibacteriota bacterium]MBU1728412.1 AmmeMemoRadiSam system protein A [Candidatus Margulisiibacteriota bacterium]MBU1954559.1 AmmeMemoRadiSam system protein A [Candidatus Margulisiibacteriota bacterium]
MTESAQVKLARETIETYVRDKKVIKPPDPLPKEMQGKAGVFVSLKKKGALRGCIGTFAPTTENVAVEIIRNAIESSTRDPRFPPVIESELKELEISVDILTAPEPVESVKDLDAKKYGVIVKSGMRRGLLLPDLPGVNSPQQQIEICRMKGGIKPTEPVELFRFEVKRYK